MINFSIPTTLCKILLSLVIVYGSYESRCQNWERSEGPLETKWTLEVTPQNAWSQYPRPQLVRENWKNLNGLWEYKIQPKGLGIPNVFDGDILVPYAIESSLSGVGKPLKPDQELWYREQFEIPRDWKNKHIILHFGAVDWQMELFINGKSVGTHQGGSDPFSFDITSFLRKEDQEITIRVWDPTDTDIQPRGKQTLDPRGFWYTAVSGIWQTVWLEPVHKTYVNDFYTISDIENSEIRLITDLINKTGAEQMHIQITYNGLEISNQSVPFSSETSIPIPDAKLWSPSFPNLYDIKVSIKTGNEVVDTFSSYFGMRKIEVKKNEDGYQKLFLNNEELFHWGVLDQGWWPDGLLTPPTDDALLYDMQVVKSLGFNVIRKHIKVEPARFYYHADQIGLMIWQDMPTGFLSIHHPQQHVEHDALVDWDRPEESAQQFKKEWKSIMDSKRSFPSVVVWVPFNEGWGQFATEEIVNWTMSYDTTRLVDGVSGWTDRGVGHMYDSHQYPGPGIEPAKEHPNRATVLGEFGGLGHPIKGHLWDESRKNWGYRTYEDFGTYINEYARLINNVYPELSRGLSAAIFTQTTDVEAEVNGLLTYDRKVQKIPTELARVLHKPLFDHEVKPARFLISDSELIQNDLFVSGQMPGNDWYLHNSFDEAFLEQKGPVNVSKGEDLWMINSFTLDSIPDRLAAKIYAIGDVTIRLNGVIIDQKYYRTKRHYDDINLSNFTSYLKEGKNIIAVELLNIEEDSVFDFGIYTY